MSRTFDHERLSAQQLSAGLSEAGLSVPQFERLTGTRGATVRRWLMPAGHRDALEPPFWVTSWLALYLLPGAPEQARTVAEAKLIGGADDAT